MEERSSRDVSEFRPLMGLPLPSARTFRARSKVPTLEDFYSVDPQPILARFENRAGVTISASPQEMAVTQSHLNTWRRVANEGLIALIVEDDTTFLPDFGSRVGQLWAELSEMGAGDVSFDLLRPWRATCLPAMTDAIGSVMRNGYSGGPRSPVSRLESTRSQGGAGRSLTSALAPHPAKCHR